MSRIKVEVRILGCPDSPAKQDERLKKIKLRLEAKAEVDRIKKDLVLAQEKFDELS